MITPKASFLGRWHLHCLAKFRQCYSQMLQPHAEVEPLTQGEGQELGVEDGGKTSSTLGLGVNAH